jgi:hypothetical protein
MWNAHSLPRVSQQALTAVLQVPVLCEKLSVDGLARLATCSKASSADVDTILSTEGLGLLQRAMDTVRHSGEQQHYKAVAWLAEVLLRKVPATAAVVTERLINLPSVPINTAKQLVAAGLRITYAQPAHSMVAGVEVWVQAQQQLGIQTGIPALAVAICCGDDWVSDSNTQWWMKNSCMFAALMVLYSVPVLGR